MSLFSLESRTCCAASSSGKPLVRACQACVWQILALETWRSSPAASLKTNFYLQKTLLLSFVIMQIIWLSFRRLISKLWFHNLRCRNCALWLNFMHKTRHFLMRATFFSEKQNRFFWCNLTKNKRVSFQRTFATQCVLKLTSRSCRGGSARKHIK